MSFRRFLRGDLPDAVLEAVARDVVERYEGPEAVVNVESLDANNWLSVPVVVNDRWFLKVITGQHTLVHTLLTTGRNIGAFTSGTEGFFERFSTPIEMAEHELEATRRMRRLGVNAPEPLEAFEHDGVGVLVLEYLPSFRTLDELPPEEAQKHAPALFAALCTMHDDGLAHGDLREENVLVAPGDDGTDRLYFIDATRVDEAAIDDARAYDLACALASLSPHIGVEAAVIAAQQEYSTDDLLSAREFINFVNMRPDHDFDMATLKGEIEKRAS
ncbi:MAG: lipopolysaccharide kinase InaA family protein [Natronomonas sp.]